MPRCGSLTLPPPFHPVRSHEGQMAPMGLAEDGVTERCCGCVLLLAIPPPSLTPAVIFQRDAKLTAGLVRQREKPRCPGHLHALDRAESLTVEDEASRLSGPSSELVCLLSHYPAACLATNRTRCLLA